MKKALIALSILLGVILSVSLFRFSGSSDPSKVFHYYVTVADENHFPQLINLIASIHKVDYDHLDEIAVFDIGLAPEQRKKIENIDKVKVYEVEKTNPDILKYFTTNPYGRQVRGWFAWKPVVIKQALDIYPYYLYLDSGVLVLNSPDNLFKHIKQNGYFIMAIGSDHNIEQRITKPVVQKLLATMPKDTQEYLLRKNTLMIDAGFQGISRQLSANYVLPMYRLSSDLSLFEDDGSSSMGFGGGRHDQTLFSIYANLAKLNFNSQDWTELKVDGMAVPFHSFYERAGVNDKTVIYRSRADFNYGGRKTQFIRWRSQDRSLKVL